MKGTKCNYRSRKLISKAIDNRDEIPDKKKFVSPKQIAIAEIIERVNAGEHVSQKSIGNLFWYLPADLRQKIIDRDFEEQEKFHKEIEKKCDEIEKKVHKECVLDRALNEASGYKPWKYRTAKQ